MASFRTGFPGDLDAASVAVEMRGLLGVVRDLIRRFDRVEGSAVGDVDAADVASAAGLCRAVTAVGDDELGEVFAELMRARALLEGAAVSVLAEATMRGAVKESTATDPGAWARLQCRTAGVALTASTAAMLREAIDLRARPGRSAGRPLLAAVETGAVPVASVRPVARELERLAGVIAPEHYEAAASELIGWAAQGAGAGELRAAGQAIAATYGGAAFEDEQARAHRRREATGWRGDGDGGWELALRTDNEGKAVLDAAFDALAAPARPATVTDPDGFVVDVVDTRTAGQRRHDALIELARVVATDPTLLSGRRPVSAAKAQITVTLDYARLAGRVRAVQAGAGAQAGGGEGGDQAGEGEGGDRVGRIGQIYPGGPGAASPSQVDTAAVFGCGSGGGYGLDGHGTPLTPATIRRLACDAGIIPAVLASDGAILDFGRSRRLASAEQIAYLRHRDRGCVFPGCDRPPAWCDAHHLDEWDADHGSTDVDNLALLCTRHHTIVHSHHLHGTRLPGGDLAWTARGHARGRPLLTG